jgi:EAL domain-containing protein (putative c-di-GMP-specific phosphodiesterase class I)
MMPHGGGHEWPSILEEVVEQPGRVRAHFQPIVDLERGEVCGYEALARFTGWPDVPPADFFAAAERHGMAGALEARTVRSALEARPRRGSDPLLSINVSPSALVSSEVGVVFEEAERLDGVIVEVTEQSDTDLGELSGTLRRLRARGALVAVDDAGSGYGSLGRITALRPHFVKLDRSIVGDVHDDPAKAAVVEMLSELAERMDSTIIAEGVERLEDLDALIRMRVPLGQGYAFGRPGPGLGALEPEIAERIRDRWRPDRRELAIAPLVESVPTLPEPVSDRALGVLFDRRPGPDYVALIDDDGRPSGLVRRADHERGDGPVRALTLVTPDMPVAVAGRRAMARPSACRFDPLVCWDASGRYAGLVRIERVIDALALAAAA